MFIVERRKHEPLVNKNIKQLETVQTNKQTKVILRRFIMKNFNKANVMVADVLTTSEGKRYVVIADDYGTKSLLNLDSNSQTFAANYFDDNSFGTKINSKKGVFVKAERFSAAPTANRLSEALKICTGARLKYDLVTVWTAKSQQQIDLENRADEIRKKIDDLNNELDKMETTIANMD